MGSIFLAEWALAIGVEGSPRAERRVSALHDSHGCCSYLRVTCSAVLYAFIAHTVAAAMTPRLRLLTGKQ